MPRRPLRRRPSLETREPVVEDGPVEEAGEEIDEGIEEAADEVGDAAEEVEEEVED